MDAAADCAGLTEREGLTGREPEPEELWPTTEPEGEDEEGADTGDCCGCCEDSTCVEEGEEDREVEGEEAEREVGCVCAESV